MRLWRLSRAVYNPLDGEGARLAGGRWNSPGVPVVYTSTSLSLAILELLVHLNPAHVPKDLMVYEIELPDSVTVDVLPDNDLPPNWRNMPESEECRSVGDSWLASGKSVALQVPSVVLPDLDVVNDSNILLNPSHADIKQVNVVSKVHFSFDPRLL